MTGKTLLALAAALSVRGSFRQIFLARPIIPLSNRDLGYLPGDLDAKLDPFMQPLFDNLAVIRHQFSEIEDANHQIGSMLESGSWGLVKRSFPSINFRRWFGGSQSDPLRGRRETAQSGPPVGVFVAYCFVSVSGAYSAVTAISRG